MNHQSSHGYLVNDLQIPAPTARGPVNFECVIMPDGSRNGRKMYRTVLGNAYAAFYPLGRKDQFWVTWGTMDDARSGGEAAGSFPMAEFRATEILHSLNR